MLNSFKPCEQPVHRVALKAFRLDRTTVTNEAFAGFVDATGFVTESERYGWSFVFGGGMISLNRLMGMP